MSISVLSSDYIYGFASKRFSEFFMHFLFLSANLRA